MKLRIKFRKYGPIRFIGHLDVMRYFQKNIRRAGIDVAYTSGFSPHQIMSFAAPLGVGLESNGEYMDIEVNQVTDSKDIMRRLNEAGVEGIEIVSVKALPDKAENAMASVAAAEYTISFREGYQPIDNCTSKITEFMSQEHIYVQKETKKGIRELDIKPGIYHFNYSDSCFHMLVDASSAGNLKPGLILKAFYEFCGEAFQEKMFFITREDTYTNVGNEEEIKLVTLDDIGTLF